MINPMLPDEGIVITESNCLHRFTVEGDALIVEIPDNVVQTEEGIGIWIGGRLYLWKVTEREVGE